MVNSLCHPEVASTRSSKHQQSAVKLVWKQSLQVSLSSKYNELLWKRNFCNEFSRQISSAKTHSSVLKMKKCLSTSPLIIQNILLFQNQFPSFLAVQFLINQFRNHHLFPLLLLQCHIVACSTAINRTRSPTRISFS